jgi:tRNA(adenine34) deaminase
MLAPAEAIDKAQSYLGEVPISKPCKQHWPRRGWLLRPARCRLARLWCVKGRSLRRGQNRVLRDVDPTAHAEIVALRAAAAAMGNYRLNGCTLYVTLEPCAMCAGAMIHARLDRLVFAAADPKAGAAGSVLAVINHPQLNHQMQVEQGILGEEAAELLRRVFRERR